MAACPSPLLTVLYHLQIAQGAPCLIVQVMKTEVKRYWSQYQPLGTLLVTHLQLTVMASSQPFQPSRSASFQSALLAVQLACTSSFCI